MSRIFRRPMFRKGGGANMNGIMSGIEDRENFQEGMSARQRLEKVAEQYPSQAVDPLGQFLIEGGLNLMSQTGGGGLLGNIGKALKEPTAGLFKAQAGKDKFKRELALAGEELDIEQEQALKIAAMKNKTKDFYSSQTPEAQFQVLTDLYAESRNPSIRDNAFNLAQFEVSVRSDPKQNYTQLGYIMNPKIKGSNKYQPDWTTIPVGNITYNPATGLAYKRVERKNNDASDYIPLNPSSLQPLE